MAQTDQITKTINGESSTNLIKYLTQRSGDGKERFRLSLEKGLVVALKKPFSPLFVPPFPLDRNGVCSAKKSRFAKGCSKSGEDG